MTIPLKIDKTLRERRRINRLLDFLKRDDLTGEQMERIGRRLQKSGKRALSPLVRKLWREQNGTAIYRYTCMLDFFDASAWMALASAWMSRPCWTSARPRALTADG